jgi:hypothetical protein
MVGVWDLQHFMGVCWAFGMIPLFVICLIAFHFARRSELMTHFILPSHSHTVISWLPSGNVVTLSPLTLVLIGMLILLDGENLTKTCAHILPCCSPSYLQFYNCLLYICALVASHQARILRSAMYEEFAKTCLFLVIWLIAVKAYALLDIVGK